MAQNTPSRRIRAWKSAAATRSKMVSKKIAVRPRCQRDASCDLGEEGACERVPGPRSRNNNSIKAEAAPVVVDRKDQLQHEQEKIRPRPFPRGIVETEPEVEDLQCTDDTPKPDEYPQHQRHCRQHFKRIDDRREDVKMRQHDVVDELGL